MGVEVGNPEYFFGKDKSNNVAQPIWDSEAEDEQLGFLKAILPHSMNDRAALPILVFP